MNFKQWVEAEGLVTSLRDALKILGLKPGANEKDILTAVRNSAMQHHPDIRGGDAARMRQINAAYDFLKGIGFETSQSYPDFGTSSSHMRPHWRRTEDLPPWQTDLRSSYNEVGNGFNNLNYCKKSIYDKSVENGGKESLNRWHIDAFDGTFFRGGFMVFSNPQTLGYAGMVMQKWNEGSNPYNTKAVFASLPGTKELILIRLDGHDVSKEMKKFHHESFNDNPGNDQEFIRMLRDSL
jgi:hypothetical protein